MRVSGTLVGDRAAVSQRKRGRVTSMEDRDIDPRLLRPNLINDPFDKELLDRLMRSMRESGWCKRRLLVEEAFCGMLRQPIYYPWTGCHRVSAAVDAGLGTVPCCVLTAAEANEAFTRAGYELGGAPSWRERLTVRVSGGEGRFDEDRLRGLEKAGLRKAADMPGQEIAATDGHRT